MADKMRKQAPHNVLDLSLTPLQRVEHLLQALTKDPEYNGFDVETLKHLEIIHVSEGRTEYSWTVTDALCNKTGMLHGGCAATVLDMVTSICLMTAAKPGYMDGGSVSRSFLCTFLAGVPVGTKCRVIAEITRGGKRFSNVRGEIRTMDGQVAVTFSHDKAELARVKI